MFKSKQPAQPQTQQGGKQMAQQQKPQQPQQQLKPIVLSQIPNISSKVLNLTSIRDQSKLDLGDAISTLKGSKAIVMDPKLIGLLNLLADPTFLQNYGGEKRYELKEGRLDTECKNIVYIVRPNIKYMYWITEHVRQHQSENLRKEYSIVFVPRATILCSRVLEEEGVMGNFVIHEFPLDIVPFDEDVLSLELSNSYRELLLDGEKTSLFWVAKSLMKLQAMFGTIPIVKGKGQCSRLVMDMIVRMRKEMSEEVTVPPEIDSLILLDREVDTITPMCTQLTYEGLIDETFGINNNAVFLDEGIVNPNQGQQQQPNAPPPPPTGKKVPFPLHSNDKVYSEIRDTNFSVLSGLLNKKAKDIDEYYKMFKTTQSISAIRDYMKKLSSYQMEHNSLRIHTCITEEILEVTKSNSFMKGIEAEQNLLAGVNLENVESYIEDCINKKEMIHKVLRLLILYSATHNGIKPKQLDFFKREIIQTYGFEHKITLDNLESLRLIRKSDTRATFPNIRKDLHLIVDDLNEQSPNDIAYTYSGYAPLPGGWRHIEEVLRLLPGPTFEEIQPLPQGATSNVKSDRKPITLVYFIGGVTFSEISALRFLSRQDQANPYKW
ncbi:hypothetical protein DICPUDRAFT_155993 [Dictyostelium purpureum]|uniref:Sec1-like family protein n=1 Tax=Dictyostelium purpureum TaxID=5786 RepID=F0ZVF0_DICPU|nr:uncharacterized protein DICPUDRAFT_155993 [Dictyostelium purpureum]EGC32075.1 hypothetical protein DICPUDRAFT_155993 [Dictyostelium purpureum]|eukprot:XP_003291398.1 hypothetical protein DICPUDRAFT_155993 [Dictyostelium purpureum]